MENSQRTIPELTLENAQLRAEKKEILDCLERFTIWPIHIEISKVGLYPALEKATGLVRKYRPETKTVQHDNDSSPNPVHSCLS